MSTDPDLTALTERFHREALEAARIALKQAKAKHPDATELERVRGLLLEWGQAQYARLAPQLAEPVVAPDGTITAELPVCGSAGEPALKFVAHFRVGGTRHEGDLPGPGVHTMPMKRISRAEIETAKAAGRDLHTLMREPGGLVCSQSESDAYRRLGELGRVVYQPLGVLRVEPFVDEAAGLDAIAGLEGIRLKPELEDALASALPSAIVMTVDDGEVTGE